MVDAYSQIDSPTSRVLPMRKNAPRAVVIHTTGETDHARILHWYQSKDGLQPHWYITTDGTRHRIVDEERIAYHCKIDPQEAMLYEQGFNKWAHWVWRESRPAYVDTIPQSYVFWRSRWPHIKSPLDLPTGAHPNSLSIGIELQQPRIATLENFTRDQYESARYLIGVLCAKWKISASQGTVYGHSDCSPMRRSTLKAPWDPPPNVNWGKLING